MTAFAERYGPWAAALGAAQGIGLAFAHECARRGVSVLLVDVREDLLAAAVREVAAAAPGVEVRGRALDLAAPDVAERLDEIDLELGLVVYTAMLALVGPFLDEKLERHEQALHVGCRGALAASHVLGRRLVARRRGGLILTSSGAGFQGTGFVAAYSAAKAFDLALAEALWWEWRPHGVDVLALCPGGTATPGMLANAPKLGRESLARPEDVAREALDALGRGPVCIPGEDNRRARAALDQLPREKLVQLMGEQTRRMFRGE
jgi:short-subunit dehydrogenase